jgi:hypothetical protein
MTLPTPQEITATETGLAAMLAESGGNLPLFLRHVAETLATYQAAARENRRMLLALFQTPPVNPTHTTVH